MPADVTAPSGVSAPSAALRYIVSLAVSTVATWAVYATIVAGTPLLLLGRWPVTGLGTFLGVASVLLFALVAGLSRRPVLSSWVIAAVALALPAILLLSRGAPPSVAVWWSAMVFFAVLLGIPQLLAAAIMTWWCRRPTAAGSTEPAQL
jgi:hypothetical protein